MNLPSLEYFRRYQPEDKRKQQGEESTFFSISEHIMQDYFIVLLYDPPPAVSEDIVQYLSVAGRKTPSPQCCSWYGAQCHSVLVVINPLPGSVRSSA